MIYDTCSYSTDVKCCAYSKSKLNPCWNSLATDDENILLYPGANDKWSGNGGKENTFPAVREIIINNMRCLKII